MLRRVLLTSLLAASVMGGAACGPLKYAVQATAKAPGADGTVIADVHADQGQTRVDIKVEHLPPPDRLEPGMTSFVAWYRRDDKAPWVRMGALKYDADGRKGVLEQATVPEVAFDALVTTEASVDPATPSPSVILAQHVQKT